MGELIPITLFTVIGLVLVLRGPLGKAFADRIAGRALGGASPKELDDLRSDLRGVVDEVQFRLTEMEERLDFTERMLARHRARDEIPRQGAPEG